MLPPVCSKIWLQGAPQRMLRDYLDSIRAKQRSTTSDLAVLATYFFVFVVYDVRSDIIKESIKNVNRMLISQPMKNTRSRD